MAEEGRDNKGHFVRGNLFSVGNNGGQPPKYDDPKVMNKKIAEYLDWEDENKRPDAYSKQGKGVYTLTGVALYLGFATRKSMDDYAERSSEFLYIIDRFRSFLTHWNEQKLYWGGTFAGSSFWLRNHGGYTDESTINQNVREYKTKWSEDKSDEE